MNMSDFDNLLNSQQLKAPENFTSGVMYKVKTYKAKVSPFPNRGYSAGLSLIAASLITLFINLTPIMNYLINDTANINLYQRETISLEHLTDSIEYFTQRMDYIINKPFSYLKETLNKEESPYEQ